MPFTYSEALYRHNFSSIYLLGIHDLQPESDWSSIRLYVNYKKTILSYQEDYTFLSKRLYFLIKKTILSVHPTPLLGTTIISKKKKQKAPSQLHNFINLSLSTT